MKNDERELVLRGLPEGVRDHPQVNPDGGEFQLRKHVSVLGASAFLPFLPMAPVQVLTNNLLYDFSQVPIPTDAVDEEQVARPRPWNIAEIKRFILFIGPISSIFDYTTFFVMLWVFKCWDPSRASVFQAGWFVESLMTQTLIIHVIRTNKIPFLQSRASRAHSRSRRYPS